MTRKGVGHKLQLAVLITMLAVLVPAVAQGAFFDTAGKSARAMGMGETFLASATDASGYWYNPAALASFESRQVGMVYGKPAMFVSDLMSSQINLVTPLGENSGLGLGFSYDGIDVASSMVVSGGYGVALGDRLSMGANVKLLYWSADVENDIYTDAPDEDLSKMSFSLDVSAIYSIGSVFSLDNLSAGLYTRNAIMPNISESGDDGGKLPIEFGIGVMGTKNDITVAGDIAMVDDETIFRVGAESPITGSALKIRGGFVYGSNFEDELEQSDINLGVGYAFGSLLFDYAYNIPMAIDETGGRHYVSFGFSF